MRTYSCSPTFTNLTNVGVFFAFQPKEGSICEIHKVTVSGSLGQLNKSLGVSLDLLKKLDLTNAISVAPETIVQHDEIDLDSNVTMVVFKIPPVVPAEDFMGRARSRRTFWSDETTEADNAAWTFGGQAVGGLAAKPIVLRGTARWLCMSTSDIPAQSFTGSIIYPFIEWVESV